MMIAVYVIGGWSLASVVTTGLATVLFRGAASVDRLRLPAPRA